jgi:cytochrome c oxidase subunit I
MTGTVTMIFTGFIYYMFPLITGRMYKKKPAQIQFIMAMIGISLVFGTQHSLGVHTTTLLCLSLS